MRTVAILGNASRTRDFAPWDDWSVAIWAMTFHSVKAERVSAVLEMHEDVLTGERWRRFPDTDRYRKWLRETDIPIYMHNINPEIPGSIQYPRQEIEAKYGHHLLKGDEELNPFYGGTASYGIALALLHGYERIELYGIELSARPQYDEERDCVFFWMGKATGLGVDIEIHKDSRLVRKMLYPIY